MDQIQRATKPMRRRKSLISQQTIMNRCSTFCCASPTRVLRDLRLGDKRPFKRPFATVEMPWPFITHLVRAAGTVQSHQKALTRSNLSLWLTNLGSRQLAEAHEKVEIQGLRYYISSYSCNWPARTAKPQPLAQTNTPKSPMASGEPAKLWRRCQRKLSLEKAASFGGFGCDSRALKHLLGTLLVRSL